MSLLGKSPGSRMSPMQLQLHLQKKETGVSRSGKSNFGMDSKASNGRVSGADFTAPKGVPNWRHEDYHKNLNSIESKFASLMASGKLKRGALSTPTTCTPVDSVDSLGISHPSLDANNSVNRDELDLSAVNSPSVIKSRGEELDLSAVCSDVCFTPENAVGRSCLVGQQHPALQPSPVQENSPVVFHIPTDEPSGRCAPLDLPSFGSPEVVPEARCRKIEDTVVNELASSSSPPVESFSSPKASIDVAEKEYKECNPQGLGKMLEDLEPLLEQLMFEMKNEEQLTDEELSHSFTGGTSAERRPVIAALSTLTKTIWELTAKNERLSSENAALQAEAGVLRMQLKDRSIHEREVAVQTEAFTKPCSPALSPTGRVTESPNCSTGSLGFKPTKLGWYERSP